MLQNPSFSTSPKYSNSIFLHQRSTDTIVSESEDWISITPPIGHSLIPRRAYSNGPGQAVPRASTSLPTFRVLSSSTVIFAPPFYEIISLCLKYLLVSENLHFDLNINAHCGSSTPNFQNLTGACECIARQSLTHS